MTSPKISPEFRRRLASSAPGQKIRAVLILQTGNEGAGRRKDRQRIMEAARKVAHAAMADLEPLLSEAGGRFLAETPDALGSIPVEATADGLELLSRNENVRAILEDQAITRFEPKAGR